MNEVNPVEGKDQSIVKQILRWIAVLPSAIGGYFIASIFVNGIAALIRLYMGIDPNSIWSQVNYYIFSAIAASATAIYWGTLMAPSKRKVVTLILGGLMVVTATISLLSATEKFYWWLASSLSSVVTAGFMVYLVFSEEIDFFD